MRKLNQGAMACVGLLCLTVAVCIEDALHRREEKRIEKLAIDLSRRDPVIVRPRITIVIKPGLPGFSADAENNDGEGTPGSFAGLGPGEGE